MAQAGSPLPEFRLIETILWEKGGFYLIDLHIKRLIKSARHFDFSIDVLECYYLLEQFSQTFDTRVKYKARLTLEKSGMVDIKVEILSEDLALPVKITISEKRTDKNDQFLYHKTTERALYDQELSKYRERGFFEVIFENQHGEITEGAVTNIVIQEGKKLFTPPVSSGLLPGVYREHLFAVGDPKIEEKVLFREDLVKAEHIYVVNSVRKTVPAVLRVNAR